MRTMGVVLFVFLLSIFAILGVLCLFTFLCCVIEEMKMWGMILSINLLCKCMVAIPYFLWYYKNVHLDFPKKKRYQVQIPHSNSRPVLSDIRGLWSITDTVIKKKRKKSHIFINFNYTGKLYLILPRNYFVWVPLKKYFTLVLTHQLLGN